MNTAACTTDQFAARARTAGLEVVTARPGRVVVRDARWVRVYDQTSAGWQQIGGGPR